MATRQLGDSFPPHLFSLVEPLKRKTARRYLLPEILTNSETCHPFLTLFSALPSLLPPFSRSLRGTWCLKRLPRRFTLTPFAVLFSQTARDLITIPQNHPWKHANVVKAESCQFPLPPCTFFSPPPIQRISCSHQENSAALSHLPSRHTHPLPDLLPSPVFSLFNSPFLRNLALGFAFLPSLLFFLGSPFLCLVFSFMSARGSQMGTPSGLWWLKRPLRVLSVIPLSQTICRSHDPYGLFLPSPP